ncbi:group III truncated hemoglobin [Flavihumibacter rivuli]|uniref:group III truncated hemoglobin n=1 Tax=Flavihumibacter rivuli TaxID=2838156 RepID=UPI001EFB0AB7|nr:group III truncated hemoglobin [Flavihumibacter rivuli]ULQ58316.1 group III truncated hemoglobin [Flavihumibacter rivuli]
MKTDITSLTDIKLLVDSFYGKVRQDGVLKDIFNDRIRDAWNLHLEKMYRFWQTVLLEEHTYNGSPFLPHANLPVSQEHFDQWLVIFNTTIDELFQGPKAEEAKWRAKKMAEMFHYKIEYYRNRQSKPLL